MPAAGKIHYWLSVPSLDRATALVPEIQAIARSGKSVVIVSPGANTLEGRARLIRALRAGGLPQEIARELGWATSRPKIVDEDGQRTVTVPKVDESPAEDPPPSAADTVKAERVHEDADHTDETQAVQQHLASAEPQRPPRRGSRKKTPK